MPMPLWWGHVNKRVFNPREIKKSDRPVLSHIGRASGKSFQTPLDAHKVDGGYIFILVYGSRSDWVKNILASGRATLKVDGQEIKLAAPRVILTEEAWKHLDPDTTPPPPMLKITEYLHMDRVT
jgi:deazaflavin-dependent oxidoreductase (nitroreductase family)